MEPEVGILALLDNIFDYFTVADLERMFSVCKYFCFVASMDKLYHKFGIFESSNICPRIDNKHIESFDSNSSRSDTSLTNREEDE
jgi:hypothetical protein